MKKAVSTVTTKGQLVIPSKLRQKYGIRKGTRVAMIEEENRIILQPLTRDYIGSCAVHSRASHPRSNF